MGGGGGWNPVESVSKAWDNATTAARTTVDTAWNKGTEAVRTGVQQESERLGVNRALNSVNNVWDDATTGVRTYAQQQGGKFYKYGKGFLSDKGRMTTAAATLGTSELWREAGAEAKNVVSANMKGGQEPAPPPVESAAEVKPPTPDNADILAAQQKERQRAKKGRASTILHGGSGITDQAQTARNTLLGA
jgi:hypothetical protein